MNKTPVTTSAVAASATPQHESRGVSGITLVATSAAASTSPQLDEHIVENEITSGVSYIALTQHSEFV